MSVENKEKIAIVDPQLEAAVAQAFEKLEKLYPEHKVFAFVSMNQKLQAGMIELSKKAGYASLEDMLAAYGYEIISKEEARELRSSVIYTPGNEPEAIKSKVERILKTLEENYPDKIIVGSIKKANEYLSRSIAGAYQWLGYKNTTEFLAAYGYRYYKSGSLPEDDLQSVLEELEKLYPEHKVFALASLNERLRNQINRLSSSNGYDSAETLLADYGYETISGEEVRKIRPSVIYTPGNEPDIIKPKIEGILKNLQKFFPNKTITVGLRTISSKLSEDILGAWQWLGYENRKAFLEAYGYDDQVWQPSSISEPGGPVDRAFKRLEELYPEHKVFALKNLNDNLYKRLGQLSKDAGYDSMESMFAAYGFETISGEEVRKIRPSVIYSPGNEPDVIKPKIELILQKLQKFFPDKTITTGLRSTNNLLARDILGVYQWLGYADAGEFLAAYGYDYQAGKPSPANVAAARDEDSVNRAFEKLEELYPEHKVFALNGIDGELRKTLLNHYEVFGYGSLNEMLKAKGFQVITAEAAKELRREVIYTPGNEPDVIQPKLNDILRKLERYYPDNIIDNSLRWSKHAELFASISGICQWLGYENIKEFLAAYGYDYQGNLSSSGTAAIIRTEDSGNRAFEKLERYFPERKVFALSAIDDELRESLTRVCKKEGYAFLNEMLAAKGFEVISGDAVKELRSEVIYTPGNEPDIIKPKVESILRRLKEYYPDKVIEGSMQNQHHQLSNNITGIYQWLGYADAGEFLAAYGFEYHVDTGRPTVDFQPIIDALIEKYKDRPKFKTLGELIFDNPEYKGNLKTLRNKSSELFGTSLAKYFLELGILASKTESAAEKAKTKARSRIQEDAAALLRMRFEKADPTVYGTAEEAMKNLEGMTVKLRKSGEIYISNAAGCGEKVVIPYGVDSISSQAFHQNENIKEVVIPGALREIPSSAFAGCINLEKVTIRDGIESIGEMAFANCANLKEVIMPQNAVRIGSTAFLNCNLLKMQDEESENIEASLDAVDFSDLQSDLPENVTDLSLFKYRKTRAGTVTITGFNGKEPVVVVPPVIEEKPVTEILQKVFAENKYIVEVYLPNYISELPNKAFKDCISLKKVHLPNLLNKIEKDTFKGCIGLKEINIPNNVTHLSEETFADSPISKIHIGKNLPAIDRSPFCSRLPRAEKKVKITQITVESSNPHITAQGAAVLSADGKTLLSYLGNAKSYKIPEGIETVGDNAFLSCGFLSEITLPSTLTRIGNHAFSSSGVKSLKTEGNLKAIGEGAFKDCITLRTAEFEPGIEIIENEAFAGCPIERVFLPKTVKKLEKDSFMRLQNMLIDSRREQGFEIDPANPYFMTDGTALYKTVGTEKTLVTAYGGRDISEQRKYKVAEGTVRISGDAFSHCFGIMSVELPQGLRTISDKAFDGCYKISRISIPNSVETIGRYAFRGTAITSFKLPAALKEIGVGAFNIQESVDFGSNSTSKRSVREIEVSKENELFYIENDMLLRHKGDGTSVVITCFCRDEQTFIPENVSEIGFSAFARSITKEIHIPSTVNKIAKSAFKDCVNLVRIHIGFAKAENGISSAVAYIPESVSRRSEYMSCLHVDKEGNIFDFVKYDELFDTITDKTDKILVATDRLKSAIQLVPFYREKYLKYLRRNVEKAVEIVVLYDDLAGLNTLAELDIFTGRNIDRLIELANKSRKPDVLSYLMNYKNVNIGIEEENYDL